MSISGVCIYRLLTHTHSRCVYFNNQESLYEMDFLTNQQPDSEKSSRKVVAINHQVKNYKQGMTTKILKILCFIFQNVPFD